MRSSSPPDRDTAVLDLTLQIAALYELLTGEKAHELLDSTTGKSLLETRPIEPVLATLASTLVRLVRVRQGLPVEAAEPTRSAVTAEEIRALEERLTALESEPPPA